MNVRVLFPMGLDCSEQFISFKVLTDKSYKFISQKKIYILARGSEDLQDLSAPRTFTKVKIWTLFVQHIFIECLFFIRTENTEISNIVFVLNEGRVEERAS